MKGVSYIEMNVESSERHYYMLQDDDTFVEDDPDNYDEYDCVHWIIGFDNDFVLTLDFYDDTVHVILDDSEKLMYVASIEEKNPIVQVDGSTIVKRYAKSYLIHRGRATTRNRFYIDYPVEVSHHEWKTVFIYEEDLEAMFDKIYDTIVYYKNLRPFDKNDHTNSISCVKDLARIVLDFINKNKIFLEDENNEK